MSVTELADKLQEIKRSSDRLRVLNLARAALETIAEIDAIPADERERCRLHDEIARDCRR